MYICIYFYFSSRKVGFDIYANCLLLWEILEKYHYFVICLISPESGIDYPLALFGQLRKMFENVVCGFCNINSIEGGYKSITEQNIRTRVDCNAYFNFTTLCADTADDKLVILFLFFPENRMWHFMQIV